MNNSEPPKDQPEESKASGEITDAIADVMMYEAKKAVAREEAIAPLDRPPSAIPWIVLAVLTLVSLYLWFGSPPFLATGEVEPIPPGLEEAGHRMEVYLQAVTVLRYRGANGRLPNSLSEAGSPVTRVEYERQNQNTFRVWIQGSDGILEYVSGDSLQALLGRARERIQMGVG
jgi:hypothetical protein